MENAVRIDQDVINYLLTKRQGWEAINDTLRRELRMPGLRGDRASLSDPEDPPKASSSRKASEVSGFLESPDFLVESNAIGRFLAILSWLCRRDEKKFEAVLQLWGTKRKYFGRRAQEIEEHGKTVKPQQIPKTAFWVSTNNSNATKRTILAAVMRVLGYPGDTITEAVSAIR